MKIVEYGKFVCNFFILKKEYPYILGLVITDVCNLNCRHCRVANIQKGYMSYSEIEKYLTTYYKRGTRFLYLEGGEPYLWRDGHRRLGDVVQLAKDIGYLRVHIYTNGTFPLDANPHLTWISIDGLAETYRAVRGIPIEKVLKNIQTTHQKRLAIIFTLNTINYKEIPEFLNFVHIQFPKLKVMFFFHTPYYGFDSLLLSGEEKLEAIETIIDCKKTGLPVLNSEAGLYSILSGGYKHPTNLWWVVDQKGQYQCCRAYGNPEVCRHCGYSSCAEIIMARSLRLSALKGIWEGF